MLEKKKRQNLSLQWQHLAQWRGNEKWNILKNRKQGRGYWEEGSEQPIVMWWGMPWSIEMLILTQNQYQQLRDTASRIRHLDSKVTVPWMMISFSNIYGNKVIKRNVFSVNRDAVILGYQCSFGNNSLTHNIPQQFIGMACLSKPFGLVTTITK